MTTSIGDVSSPNSIPFMGATTQYYYYAHSHTATGIEPDCIFH